MAYIRQICFNENLSSMCFKNTPLLQIIHDGSEKKTSLLEDTEAVNNFSYRHSSFLSDKIKEVSWQGTVLLTY